MATQELLKGLEADWDQATVGHKFVKACVDGSIKPEQFNTWLTQVREVSQCCCWLCIADSAWLGIETQQNLHIT